MYKLYEENARKPIETLPVDPIIINNKYLDVKATSAKGAVRIDAVSEIDDDGFIISMKLQRTDKVETRQQNIFYLGNKNTNIKDYYQYFRSMKAGGYLGLSKGNQDDFGSSPPTEEDKVYY